MASFSVTLVFLPEIVLVFSVPVLLVPYCTWAFLICFLRDCFVIFFQETLTLPFADAFTFTEDGFLEIVIASVGCTGVGTVTVVEA